LFINGLTNGICEEAKFLLKDKSEEIEKELQNKANKVSEMLIDTMTSLGQNKYLLSIITCYTKQSPPALNKILDIVRDLKSLETSESTKKTTPPHIDPSLDPAAKKKKADITANEALEYACWLVKADNLYDVALQTYDINMVLQVAKHTQKDPKEYLPYLKSLQELEPVYRKYQIRKDLKHFSQALAELAEVFLYRIYCKKDKENKYLTEAFELIQKYKLYEDALKLYKSNTTVYPKVCILYADFLWSISKYENAGAMYRLGGNFEKSIEAYRKAENYQICKSIALYAKYPQEKILNIAQDFLEGYRAADDYKGISTILLDLYNSKKLTVKEQIEELINSLIKARDYFKAIEICGETNMLSFIDNEIHKAVLLGYDIVYNEIEASINSYNEKRKRLDVIQMKKRTMPQLSEEMLPTGLESIDMHSESGRSRTSKAGSTSSKKSKSAKKKVPRKAVIKEGSRYEEEQIVEFLQNLVPSQDLLKEVDYIRKCMEFYGYFTQSENIEKKYKELVEMTKSPILLYEQQKIAESVSNFYDIFPKLKPMVPYMKK